MIRILGYKLANLVLPNYKKVQSYLKGPQVALVQSPPWREVQSNISQIESQE